MTTGQSPVPIPASRRRWPWVALLFVLLGITLAIVWMRREVQRLRWEQQTVMPEGSSSNAP